jgi:hypothetical protein
VKIKPEDCSKTAFITKYGLFEFARMAFGLCNTGADAHSDTDGRITPALNIFFNWASSSPANPNGVRLILCLTPLVDECLDTLAGNVWYSKLDANSAYWQVKIKPEDCSKTAFITKYGLFEFKPLSTRLMTLV